MMIEKAVSITALLVCLFSLPGRAQADYFQQEVHYQIEVSLDDTAHLLRGHIGISYINHSPDALRFLYFHLWPNAYRERLTAFGRQQLRLGDLEFYFAKDSELGYIDSLDFTAGGESLRYTEEPGHPDVISLRLPSPLRPGDTLFLATPFRVKIPGSFSRLGHVGQSYQITQWYPKPAVYDRDGWHPMPYLDMGEFYAEFGTFDVRINLPANYVVGATGVLKTPSEQAFLARRVEETKARLAAGFGQDTDFPPSSTQRKTIRYQAEQVHDFAWFADKRFHVLRKEVPLPSGRTVDAWALFTNEEAGLWKKAPDYLERSLLFFSKQVGEYPYPQVTAVQSALSAGAGMEYPMVTVIGQAGEAALLDEVITHEVGHNWFYGILASNERDHPWLDEGINTYYEERYMKEVYPSVGPLPNALLAGSQTNFNELSYLLQARRDRDQAPATSSERFSAINYWLGAYTKPALAFRYLEAYLGQPAFDQAMQAYYRQWRFRHPQPADLRRVLEAESGRDLGWLFEGLLFSNRKMDYALKKAVTAGDSLRIEVANRGQLAAPFPISARRSGEVVRTIWYEGSPGNGVVSFPSGHYDELSLDSSRRTLDLYRHNNHYRLQATFPRVEPFRLRAFPSVENDRRTTLYALPAVGWNNYDKSSLGILLFNTVFPPRHFEFALAPMYGIASKDLAGLGFLRGHWFPQGAFLQQITAGVQLRQFHFDRNFPLGYDLKYTRLQPYLRFELGRREGSAVSHFLQWRTIWLRTQRPVFSMQGNPEGAEWNHAVIHELSYAAGQDRGLSPFRLEAALEYQRYEDVFREEARYLKASLEWDGAFYYSATRRFDLRLFLGGFIFNDRRTSGAIFPGAFNLIGQGYNDYRFDDLYLGRNEDAGIWSQQVSLRDGGLKAPVASAFNLGRSNSMIVAINLKTDLPGEFPGGSILKPYFDIGYFANAMPTGRNDSFRDQLLWSGGLMIDLFDGVFGVYFPVFNSRNLADRLAEGGNYFTRISYHIDFDRLNPFDLADRLRF